MFCRWSSIRPGVHTFIYWGGVDGWVDGWVDGREWVREQAKSPPPTHTHLHPHPHLPTYHDIGARPELRLLRPHVPGPAHDEAGLQVLGVLGEALQHQVRLHGQLAGRGDDQHAWLVG